MGKAIERFEIRRNASVLINSCPRKLKQESNKPGYLFL